MQRVAENLRSSASDIIQQVFAGYGISRFLLQVGAFLPMLQGSDGITKTGDENGTKENASDHEVCLYGDKRQFRQHVQHGRGFPVSAVPAAAAKADTADQPVDRFPGDHHLKRPC